MAMPFDGIVLEHYLIYEKLHPLCDEADFKLKTSLDAVILVRRYSSSY